MQLLLDSAMIDEARQAAEWGWVSGATTNPTLLAKSDLPPAITLKQLGIFFKGPIFYQLTGETVELMTEEARLVEDLLGKQLVLKIPATALGFQAAARLSQKYVLRSHPSTRPRRLCLRMPRGRSTRSIITTAPNACCRMAPTLPGS